MNSDSHIKRYPQNRKSNDDMAINQFRSIQNIQYLRKLFTRKCTGTELFYILNTLDLSIKTFDAKAALRFNNKLLSLPTAPDFWSKVKYLNYEFYKLKLSTSKFGLGLSKSYESTLFDECLKPKGYEHLNDEILYDTNNEQFDDTISGDDSDDGSDTISDIKNNYRPLSHNLTKSQKNIIKDSKTFNVKWREIPFWRRTKRGHLEKDIDETLGYAPRELPTQLRKWN